MIQKIARWIRFPSIKFHDLDRRRRARLFTVGYEHFTRHADLADV